MHLHLHMTSWHHNRPFSRYVALKQGDPIKVS